MIIVSYELKGTINLTWYLKLKHTHTHPHAHTNTHVFLPAEACNTMGETENFNILWQRHGNRMHRAVQEPRRETFSITCRFTKGFWRIGVLMGSMV